MKRLIERLGKVVEGMLTGFDRIVFKGSIRPLSYEEGAVEFLGRRGVLNKDYKCWMMTHTERLIEALDHYARQHSGCGITHMKSWREDNVACRALWQWRERLTGDTRHTGSGFPEEEREDLRLMSVRL